MLRGNKLRGRATCCGQQVACCLQQVARPRNNFVDGNKQHVASSNMLRATSNTEIDKSRYDLLFEMKIDYRPLRSRRTITFLQQVFACSIPT